MNKKLLGAAALMAMAAVTATKTLPPRLLTRKKARQEKLAFTPQFILISWINSVNPMSPRLSRA